MWCGQASHNPHPERAGICFTPRRQQMEEATGQGCCAVVLSNDAFTDQHRFIFKQSHLCLRSPVKATKDEGKLSTHFLSLIPTTVTQGGESHPGCCILVRAPYCTPWATGASPHGIPSLRASWTWGRQKGRGVGHGESRPLLTAQSPMHQGRNWSALQLFFHLAVCNWSF